MKIWEKERMLQITTNFSDFINIEVSFASKKAVEKIKSAGGNIKTTVK